jgi:hypothetical protein
LNSATQFLIPGGRRDASCTCTLVVIPVPAIVVRHCAPLIAALSAFRRPLLHLLGGGITDIADEGRILAAALFAHALLCHRRSGHAFGLEYLRSPALTPAAECRLLIALTPSDVCRLLLALTPAAECRLLLALTPTAECRLLIALTPAAECRLLIALTPAAECRLFLALTPTTECRLLIALAYPTAAIVAGHDSTIGKPAAQFG